MSKFLVGCHYNEEEISRLLEKNIGYWPVQINGNKFATGQILEKPVEVVKGRILGPLHTWAKSRDLVMVRTLDSHPKAVPWVLGKPLYVVTGPQA